MQIAILEADCETLQNLSAVRNVRHYNVNAKCKMEYHLLAKQFDHVDLFVNDVSAESNALFF